MMGFVDYESLSDADKWQALKSGVPVGISAENGQTLLIPTIDRYRGTYILGQQGSGKSGELENMALADIHAGLSVIVLDPHGDLVDKIVAAMPLHRLAKTYVFDMLDEAHPFGINLFGLSGKPRSYTEKGQAVDRIMHVFRVLWPEVENHQYLPMYVRTATIALIHHPTMTLMHMRRFLTNKPFRDAILRDVHDADVHEHWAEHDRLSEKDQHTRIQPLLNRLSGIFLGHNLIQNILGQQTTISFRKAIENHEIILIKLPLRQLGDQAELLGKVIVAQIGAALYSFADLPEEQRPGFSWYVDEFQNFATDDVARFFSEGRKFGMRIVLAHQQRDQLHIPELRAATASAFTKICFTLNADDAREMAPYFPAPESDVDRARVETQMSKYLLEEGHADAHTRKFIDMYLRPMRTQLHGGKVFIEDKQWHVDVGQALLWGAKAGVTRNETYVADPTPYLDGLLRDVMRDGNPNRMIPWEAIVGFSNCGRKFFTAARRMSEIDMSPRVQYPRSCVVLHNGELRWVKTPNDAHEQMYHCIFLMRQMMKHLAAHPIGAVTKVNANAVAQQLTQLQKRSAFIRSGSIATTIYTMETPPHLSGRELAERVEGIRTQTRARYCHPREQVEAMFRHQSPPPSSHTTGAPAAVLDPLEPIAGWGQVDEP